MNQMPISHLVFSCIERASGPLSLCPGISRGSRTLGLLDDLNVFCHHGGIDLGARALLLLRAL